MDIVLDASVCGCWAFDDEDHPIAARALSLADSGTIHVPSLWWFEIRNLLLINERRNRLTEVKTQIFLGWMNSLQITLDRSPVETTILQLARRHRLTVYDTSYLELALRANMALATLDQKLAAAAKSEGVTLIA
jgi:predicted nucleic acid-binding protein